MRVARYYNNHDVRLEEMPRPQIGSGELLVQVYASGICGSDVMEWYRIKKAPLVLGHEITGTIVEVGDRVHRYKVGDRVAVSHHVPCNTCRFCLKGDHTICDTLRSTNFDPGGFSEYIRVPKINVESGTFLLSDDISFEDGSFIEPLACVIRGQRKAGVKKGQSVLVIGSGISGILHIKLARVLGAGKVIATDVNDFRLEAATKAGADCTARAEEDIPTLVRGANDGFLADVVIVCAGAASAISQALESVERGGTILLFALPAPGTSLPFSFWEFWNRGVTLTSTYAGSPSDIVEAIDLLHRRKVQVNDMITHRFGLADTGKGFQLVAESSDSLKVIIEPQK